MEIYRLPSWVQTEYDMELYHSGAKGMKWGLRRWQNEDGSLTPAGRIRYGVGQARSAVGSAASAARQAGDKAYTSLQSYSNLDTSQTRAANLGERGSGVSHRSRIGKHTTLSYDSNTDTFKPTLSMKTAERYLDSSGLRDRAMDAARTVELVRIGRSYGERYGGYTTGGQNYNMATRGVAKGDIRIARKGRSASTNGYTPYGRGKGGLIPGALERDYNYAMESRKDDYSERQKKELEEYKKKYARF